MHPSPLARKCLARAAATIVGIVCLAGQADLTLTPGDVAGVPCPLVQVQTDQPVLACLAAQYAGWQISVGKFFAIDEPFGLRIRAH